MFNQRRLLLLDSMMVMMVMIMMMNVGTQETKFSVLFKDHRRKGRRQHWQSLREVRVTEASQKPLRQPLCPRRLSSSFGMRFLGCFFRALRHAALLASLTCSLKLFPCFSLINSAREEKRSLSERGARNNQPPFLSLFSISRCFVSL